VTWIRETASLHRQRDAVIGAQPHDWIRARRLVRFAIGLLDRADAAASPKQHMKNRQLFTRLAVGWARLVSRRGSSAGPTLRIPQAQQGRKLSSKCSCPGRHGGIATAITTSRLLRKSFDGVEHDLIDLNDQAPCLAAPSFITVKDVPLNEDLVGVAINILPVSETRTRYSPMRRRTKGVSAVLDRILGSTGDVQKYELLKARAEPEIQVLISPRHFDQWGEERKKKIADAFVRTVESQQDVGEDADFMLF
jgi:hypothetical protein